MDNPLKWISSKMVKSLDWVAIILIGVSALIILSILIFLIYGLEPTYVGPIGDTFGGLFSPIIGIVSIVYVFKSFSDQRNQHNINRITDIIYQQIQRLDGNLGSQRFIISEDKVEGRAGLYKITNLIKDVIVLLNESESALNDSNMEQLEKIIYENINQLTDYYDHVFTSMAIVQINVRKANLSNPEVSELHRLFQLNLGIYFERSVNTILSALKKMLDSEDFQFEDSRIDTLRKILDEIVLFSDEALKSVRDFGQ